MATVAESLVREAVLAEAVAALVGAGQPADVVARLMTRRCLAVHELPGGQRYICQRHVHPDDEAHVPHETTMWWMGGGTSPIPRCTTMPEGWADWQGPKWRHSRCHRTAKHHGDHQHEEVAD